MSEENTINLNGLDELGFPLENEEIISKGLNTEEKEKLSILSQKKRDFERFMMLSEKETRYKLTRDIKLTPSEDLFLTDNSEITFSESEKDELKALRLKQLEAAQGGLTDSKKCGSCGLKESENSDMEFFVIPDIVLHELIPLNADLCSDCYNFFEPLSKKAAAAAEKRVFCLSCDKDLTPTIPLLSQFESKYAIVGVCEGCYDIGKDFKKCSIGFEEKHAIFTSEHGYLCLFHAYLKGFQNKTQEIANRKQIGDLGFGTT